MKSLGRALGRGKEAGGELLPTVFQALEDAKIRARMGTATFIAGPPGAFKTGFTLFYFLRLGLPTLYLSADAEDFEMDERAAAAISGSTMDEVRDRPEDYTELLRENTRHLRLVFNDSPTYEDVDLDVAAFMEIFGQPPRVIVIDNLMNVVGEQENEWAAMRDTARFIHHLARTTGAAVFVLHHMADDRQDTTTPAPRSKLQGKVSQLPKNIWSLALDGDRLKVAQVKSKLGPEDPTGKTFVTLWVDPSRSRIFDSKWRMEQGMVG